MITELLDPSGNAHDDWVRDVSWCNNIGATNDLIATCCENKQMKIWKAVANQKWELI